MTVWRWRPLRPGELDSELIGIAALGSTALLSLAWLKGSLPLPACPLKALTGCPCPTCGATRAALSLLHGHYAAALAWNPLVALAALAATLYSLYAATVTIFRQPRFRPHLTPAKGRTLICTTTLLLAANWAWVIHHGN